MVAAAISALAGIYPAIYISRLDGSDITRSHVPTSFKELFIRKGLVIFQFTLSTIFITSVIVVYNQLQFVQSKELGYKKDNLLYFNVGGNTEEVSSRLLSEIHKIPGVLNASSMMGSFTGQGNGLPGFIEYEGKKITMHQMAVNYDLLETVGIQIKEGRTFSRSLDHNADTMKWIFNEAAVKAIGTSDLVGKIVSDREIIGIAKNFHFQAQYKPEQAIATVAKYFAILAVIISCLGVFGLAAFSMERRKREIGIRKVLGATEMRILVSLSNEFIHVVLIAILIALPVSYELTSRWLQTFAYNIDLSWWHFTAAGFLALVTALITVCSLTMKASTSNPVDVLKA